MSAVLSEAQTHPRIEECAFVQWDYEPHPQLLMFEVYVSQQSGVYGARPLLTVPSSLELGLQVPCAQVARQLQAMGIWYAVAVAVARGPDGENSDWSNEISFQYGALTPVRPPLPVTPIKPPVGTPPTFPQMPTFPPRPPVQLPPPVSRSPSGNLTDSCQWQGTCGSTSPLPPVRDSSGSETLTNTCAWRGTCSR